jgi:XRE family transcriptional regulator, regulator of sulfur utilization
MGLSLRELGEKAGVSAQMIGQVERGETSPTLAVANRIASGLELSLSQLLRLDESEGVTVVRQRERRAGASRANGHSYELLTPELPGQRAEVSWHVLRPGAATGGPDDPPIHEPGSRETAVLIEGSLRLTCAGVPYDLEAGDAVTFDADLPHRFENPGRNEARFMAVVTAGLRRS